MRRKQLSTIARFASLFAAATLVPALAFGQPTTTTQPYPPCTKAVGTAESDLAHQKYIAGKQDYDEGNYDSAIRRFRDAYNLDCTKHELLIIISAAYERKGDKKEALNALETYVARAPSAPDVGTYQAKIDNLKKQIAQAAPPTPTAPPTASSTAPVGGEVQEHTSYPWIVVGVGGAALVVGIVLIATTGDLPAGCSKDKNECTPIGTENPAKNPPDAQSRADQQALDERRSEAGRIKTQPNVGLGVAIGGGALIVGGLVWHFLEPTGTKESASKANTTNDNNSNAKPTAKLTPAVAPNFAGMSLGGTF